MNFYQRVGSRLRALRLQAGLSQARLGERLGVTAGAINRYEAGGRRVPLSDIPRIAAALGVPASALLGFEAGERAERLPEAVREAPSAYRVARSPGPRDASAYARSLTREQLRALAAQADLPASLGAASLRRYAALIAGDYARRGGVSRRRRG